MQHKIVILDGATLNPGDNPWTPISDLAPTQIFPHTAPGELLSRAEQADVLVINKVKLSAETLAKLPKLKLIAVTATGYDCVDVAAAKQRGITVCNVPEYGTDSVAQHVFALMLHHCQQVALHDAAVKQGEWSRSLDFCFFRTPLVELAGKTLGIIGFGRIGRRVAEIAHAFGMRVVANSRSQKSPPSWQPFAWVTQDELLAQSDFVSLHCALTAETKAMVDRQFLARLRPQAVLINTSRGGLINEADLATALRQGTLAAALLDVLSAEPPPEDNPLLSAPHVTITPHNAWATLAARQRLSQTTAENIAAFFAGRPQNVVAS
jgi:glycerate dehydrogenase